MTDAAGLGRRFEGVIFDWDGTAVPDRRADADELRVLVEDACELGLHLAVVSGTHLENIDGQLEARPRGPGTLHLLLNRGSEVFRVGEDGASLLHRRTASDAEEAALTAAAEATVARLRAHGLDAAIVSARLNRRKLDLIPEPAWADPPKAQIAELLEAVRERLHDHGIESLAAVVEIAREAAAQAGLPDARVTTDAKHVEIGLTDKSDSAAWFFAELWRRGIGPRLVLVAGDELGPLDGVPGSDSLLLAAPAARRAGVVSVGVEPGGVPDGVEGIGGGPGRFLGLMAGQLEGRRHGSLPELDGDPAWTLRIDGFDPLLERAHESLLTLADGRIGTSGGPLWSDPAARAEVHALGVYTTDGAESQLVACPLWTAVDAQLKHPAALRRTLDLHTGLLTQEHPPVGARALLFSSLARPGTVVMRGNSVAAPGRPLVAPDGRAEVGEADDGRDWVRVKGGDQAVTAAASQRTLDGVVERVGAYAVAADAAASSAAALATQRAAAKAGFERLLDEHRSAWAGRWETSDVRIEGDPELQFAVRFGLFHLMASVPDAGEAAVGARGLTGPAYSGHVFWDACVFVLPFLAATHATSARAMLEYRLRRLPAARAAARAAGKNGARFPWESAATGHDVTPASAFNAAGERLEVATGEREEHIVADVAWAAALYAAWTGDADFLSGAGGQLLAETARYWASRIESDPDGSAHIRAVMGPDEYHDSVDDNAFTNVMARWNLRTAARECASSAQPQERGRWRELAEALVDGYHPQTQLYEQFAGFFDLTPLVIADLAPRRPISAELLLGRKRVDTAQVVKQGDVLMLQHMLPDEVAPGSLAPNVAFYEPRTAHASSLSPGIHAALLARVGRIEEALELLRLTARIDLDDVSETTAGGLHLAAMGSVWQAIVFGFAGVRPAGEVLAMDPRLPEQWTTLEFALTFRGTPLRMRIDDRGVTVRAPSPVRIAVGGRAPETVEPPGGLVAASDSLRQS